jgi:hypothetical protein
MSATHRLRLITLLGTALATLAVSGAVAPVSAVPTVAQRQAHKQAQKQQGQESRTLVASGFDNPRQLAFDRRGRLYVAEAGRGGAGPCITGGAGTRVCFGASGAVSRIGRRGRHHRVASGFPSLAAAGGGFAIGPADILPGKRGRYTLSIGLENNPAVRARLPWVGRHFMGTLTAGRFHHGRFVLADLGRYEAAADPDHGGPDTDPVGFIRRGRGFVVADAGANDIVAVSRRGNVSAIRTFGTRKEPNPFGGPPVDMQSVPTSVVRGRNGVLFVSELTGFPFPPGAARIFRIVPGQRTQVFATGLTNVTDLAVHRGQLYAVQIADQGLLAPGMPSGSLVRVVPGGTPVTVADNLQAPYGVAIRRGKAYVTTCSVCPGGGGVVKIPLHY